MSCFSTADFQSTATQSQQIDDTFAKNVNLRNISSAFTSGMTETDR